MSFSPDGRTLITWYDGRPLRLLEAASGKVRREVACPNAACVRASPAAPLVAIAAKRLGTVYLCDWRFKSPPDLKRQAQDQSQRLWQGVASGNAADASEAVLTLASAVGEASEPKELTQDRLGRLWDDLASDSATDAWQAVLALAAAPEGAVGTLRERLRREHSPGDRELEKLTAQLDDDAFENREEATRRLAAAGDAAEPILRRALADHPSAELGHRVQKLLAQLAPPNPLALRQVRVVEALEYAGTAEARSLLKEWASASEDCLLRDEARAAVRRLEQKPSHAEH